MLREAVYEYIKKTYGCEPEYLWAKFPGNAVFRHKENRKWFAAVLPVKRQKLGLPGQGDITVLNIKSDPVSISFLSREEGYFPGYHMNKSSWLSVVLDGSVEQEHIFGLIDRSFKLTAAENDSTRPPKDWLIPASPKVCDIDALFKNKEVEWHQRCKVKKGDSVYIYVTEPVGAIGYKCKVVKADIPSPSGSKYKYRMRLRLVEKYPTTLYTRALLDTHGVSCVRSARTVPRSLSALLNK